MQAHPSRSTSTTAAPTSRPASSTSGHPAPSRPHGLYYAPDPSSQSACTIGGNVAENSGGPHTLKYGVTVNHVLGARARAAATATWSGSAARWTTRRATTWSALVVGSRGHPRHRHRGAACGCCASPRRTARCSRVFDAVDDASRRGVRDIIAAGIVPAALEMMDPLDHRGGRGGLPLRLPDRRRRRAADRARRPGRRSRRSTRAARRSAAAGTRARARSRRAATRPSARLLWKCAQARVRRDGTAGAELLHAGRRRAAHAAARDPARHQPTSRHATGCASPTSSTPATATSIRSCSTTSAMPDEVERVLAAGDEILDACLDARRQRHRRARHRRREDRADAAALLAGRSAGDDARCAPCSIPSGAANPDKIFPDAEGVRGDAGPAPAGAGVSTLDRRRVDGGVRVAATRRARRARRCERGRAAPSRTAGARRERVVAGGTSTWARRRARSMRCLRLRSAGMRHRRIYQAARHDRHRRGRLSLRDLRGHARRAGQWLPLDPPRSRRTTVGGLIAADLTGPLRASQARSRDCCSGLTVVGGRRRDHPRRRPGGEERRRLRSAEALRGLARHARGDRRGDVQGAAAARVRGGARRRACGGARRRTRAGAAATRSVSRRWLEAVESGGRVRRRRPAIRVAGSASAGAPDGADVRVRARSRAAGGCRGCAIAEPRLSAARLAGGARSRRTTRPGVARSRPCRRALGVARRGRRLPALERARHRDAAIWRRTRRGVRRCRLVGRRARWCDALRRRCAAPRRDGG